MFSFSIKLARWFFDFVTTFCVKISESSRLYTQILFLAKSVKSVIVCRVKLYVYNMYLVVYFVASVQKRELQQSYWKWKRRGLIHIIATPILKRNRRNLGGLKIMLCCGQLYTKGVFLSYTLFSIYTHFLVILFLSFIFFHSLIFFFFR